MPDAPPDAAAIEARIRGESFEVLGWLDHGDGVEFEGRSLVLIGNAGPAMFGRFASERDPAHDLMDHWTRDVLAPLADELGAHAQFPFDTPHPPFLTWARAAGAGHTSPLGMNIHPKFGLWHAYRAAFLFDHGITHPSVTDSGSPCDSCPDKPCLATCPVGAFTRDGYDVPACAAHLSSPQGEPCRTGGCMARNACPVALEYFYSPDQTRFHMVAFMKARGVDPETIG
ncbi:hypothetical protein [Anderseniella sp. Alg231-50]|uniref:hypothetical protein n=1 Tax=Anderseniella sp. Alg231-50 TaxID=1922226 RepID=UPI000D55B5E4